MNRFCSIFSQLLQLFSRIEFQKAVKRNKSRASCPRIHLLGTVCGHALLSIGPGPFPPGDYRGSEKL